MVNFKEFSFNIWNLKSVTPYPLLLVSETALEQLNLIQQFQLSEHKMRNFFMAIQNKYNDVPYHNFYHATDVTQAVYSLGISGNLFQILNLNKLQKLAMIVAAAIHDVGHPGRTGKFLISTFDKLAILYNDISPLENMHLATAFEIWLEPKNNFTKSFQPNVFHELRKLIIELVLATDNDQHFELTTNMNHVMIAATTAVKKDHDKMTDINTARERSHSPAFDIKGQQNATNTSSFPTISTSNNHTTNNNHTTTTSTNNRSITSSFSRVHSTPRSTASPPLPTYDDSSSSHSIQPPPLPSSPSLIRYRTMEDLHTTASSYFLGSSAKNFHNSTTSTATSPRGSNAIVTTTISNNTSINNNNNNNTAAPLIGISGCNTTTYNNISDNVSSKSLNSPSNTNTTVANGTGISSTSSTSAGITNNDNLITPIALTFNNINIATNNTVSSSYIFNYSTAQIHTTLKTILHAADISTAARPWEIYTEWSQRILDEFYAEGDQQRELNMEITFAFDRHHPEPLNKFQAVCICI